MAARIEKKHGKQQALRRTLKTAYTKQVLSGTEPLYKGKGKEENAQTKDRDNRGVILLRVQHGRCGTKGEGNVKECFKKGLMSGKEILSCSAQGGRKRTAGIR